MKANRKWTRCRAERLDDHLSLYDFELPQSCIAQRPAEPRDASRLMVLAGNAEPQHSQFLALPDFLQDGDLLVRNDTRVIPARLRGMRRGGGKAELLLIHRLPPADDGERWLCLARPASSLKPGRPVTFGAGSFSAIIEERQGEGRVVAHFPDCDETALFSALQAYGEVPLPPYIDRGEGGPDSLDAERYQTTYARSPGAVAAPTAGLHFTPRVEDALAKRNIEIVHLTLHVGPGTFRPIKTEHLAEHAMDAEYYDISPDAAERITTARRAGRRIVAVGTTTTRTLESVTDRDGVTHAGSGWTDIFIRPGHHWRGIDGLITNFHLPRSSLLVLVSALTGRERVLAAYREAVAAGYRFYSYGDAMLILP